jgi:hypothetical protein
MGGVPCGEVLEALGEFFVGVYVGGSHG